MSSTQFYTNSSKRSKNKETNIRVFDAFDSSSELINSSYLDKVQDLLGIHISGFYSSDEYGKSPLIDLYNLNMYNNAMSRFKKSVVINDMEFNEGVVSDYVTSAVKEYNSTNSIYDISIVYPYNFTNFDKLPVIISSTESHQTDEIYINIKVCCIDSDFKISFPLELDYNISYYKAEIDDDVLKLWFMDTSSNLRLIYIFKSNSDIIVVDAHGHSSNKYTTEVKLHIIDSNGNVEDKVCKFLKNINCDGLLEKDNYDLGANKIVLDIDGVYYDEEMKTLCSKDMADKEFVFLDSYTKYSLYGLVEKKGIGYCFIYLKIGEDNSNSDKSGLIELNELYNGNDKIEFNIVNSYSDNSGEEHIKFYREGDSYYYDANVDKQYVRNIIRYRPNKDYNIVDTLYDEVLEFNVENLKKFTSGADYDVILGRGDGNVYTADSANLMQYEFSLKSTYGKPSDTRSLIEVIYNDSDNKFYMRNKLTKDTTDIDYDFLSQCYQNNLRVDGTLGMILFGVSRLERMHEEIVDSYYDKILMYLITNGLSTDSVNMRLDYPVDKFILDSRFDLEIEKRELKLLYQGNTMFQCGINYSLNKTNLAYYIKGKDICLGFYVRKSRKNDDRHVICYKLLDIYDKAELGYEKFDIKADEIIDLNDLDF